MEVSGSHSVHVSNGVLMICVVTSCLLNYEPAGLFCQSSVSIRKALRHLFFPSPGNGATLIRRPTVLRRQQTWKDLHFLKKRKKRFSKPFSQSHFIKKLSASRFLISKVKSLTFVFQVKKESMGAWLMQRWPWAIHTHSCEWVKGLYSVHWKWSAPRYVSLDGSSSPCTQRQCPRR